ncbi:MAG: MFS transporter [Rhodospirillales bacterium]|nr:MFS transporter [Rhodospirillales bacterium]
MEEADGQAQAAGETPDPLLFADWQRTLWAMVAIQFVMTMSFSVLTPIMPLFLPDLGVADPHRILIWAGILTAATPLVAAFASPLWGSLADRKGRKLMLLRSGFAIALFTGLMGFAGNVWQFFAWRALMGAFAGFSTTAIALVASQVPERRLGYALGWLSTGQLVGSLVGPVIGGALADLSGSYRVPFFLTSLLTFLTTLAVHGGVREHFTPPPPGHSRRSVLAGLRMVAASPGLLPLFLVLLLAQFAVRAAQPMVTLYVQMLAGHVPALATLAGLAYSITGLADLVASPFLGKRSDRIGYRRVLLICLLGATIASVPQAFAGSYGVFLAERFGLGMFIGGILPTANALVGRLVARSDRGTVFGMTASATFLGNSLGPLVGGGVAASIGLRWVFLVPAALLLANLLWVWRTVPELEGF